MFGVALRASHRCACIADEASTQGASGVVCRAWRSARVRCRSGWKRSAEHAALPAFVRWRCRGIASWLQGARGNHVSLTIFLAINVFFLPSVAVTVCVSSVVREYVVRGHGVTLNNVIFVVIPHFHCVLFYTGLKSSEKTAGTKTEVPGYAVAFIELKLFVFLCFQGNVQRCLGCLHHAPNAHGAV